MCGDVGHPADNFKVRDTVPVGVFSPLDHWNPHIQTCMHTLNHVTTSNIYLLAGIVLYSQEELFNKSR